MIWLGFWTYMRSIFDPRFDCLYHFFWFSAMSAGLNIDRVFVGTSG